MIWILLSVGVVFLIVLGVLFFLHYALGKTVEWLEEGIPLIYSDIDEWRWRQVSPPWFVKVADWYMRLVRDEP